MTAGFAGIAFDCYGTLLEIGDDRGVTRRFARLAAGRPGPSPLVQPITLADALRERGLHGQEVDDLERDALAEAASVRPLPRARKALALASSSGAAVAIVSNLSSDYAEPIARLLPGIPLVLSFERGVSKPDPAIFAIARQVMGVATTDAAAMIGDSRRSDHAGARSAGFDAVLIADATQDSVETAPDALVAVRLLMGRRAASGPVADGRRPG